MTNGTISRDSRQYWQNLRESLTFDGRNVIHGEACQAVSGKTLPDTSAADGAQLCDIADSQPQDIDLAVASARRCWDDGSWVRQTPKQRKKVLRRLADLLMENLDELALLETLDTGRPIGDSIGVDVTYSAECFEWYADIIDKRYDEAFSTSERNFITLRREPLGVIGAIVPWNYPLLMTAWKLAPALAMGNSVVLKPDEKSPLTAIRLAQLALAAGLPAGALNVCAGLGVPAGQALGLHEGVDCVSFTGSVEVGKQLQQYAGRSNMKRVWVETGGKGPQVVFDDVTDLDKVASGIVWGAFYNQGESCSAGTRLIVQEGIHQALVGRITEMTRDLVVGDPLDPATEIGALISPEHFERVDGYCVGAVAEGAVALTGGGRMNTGTEAYFYQPTVLDGVARTARVFQEEVFGPVLAVTKFSADSEAVAIANDSSYGLAGAVWSRDLNRALSTARDVRVGVMWVNTYDSSDFGVPFGGFGQSGYGRAKSLHALEKYSDIKSLWVELD